MKQKQEKRNKVKLCNAGKAHFLRKPTHILIKVIMWPSLESMELGMYVFLQGEIAGRNGNILTMPPHTLVMFYIEIRNNVVCLHFSNI